MTAQPTLLVPISLRQCDRELAKPSAWLLPGNDPALWLAEICTWGVSLKSLRVLLIPAAANDLRAVGALVIVPLNLADQIQPSAMAQPLARIHERLYIPSDARLHPPMSDGELSDWLRVDVNVLHPTIGLIGARSEELLSIAELIAAPAGQSEQWDRAQPGVLGEPRLHSVKPAAIPDLDQIIDESRDDIGENNTLDLDPAPEESPLNRAMARGLQASYRTLSWMARLLQGSDQRNANPRRASAGARDGAGEGWLARMRAWSERRMAELSASLEAARHREMTRLLRMLEKDPDNGLKYALPLNDPGRMRGVAPPGWRLGARKVDFSLGSIFGSRSSAPWQSSAEMHRALMAKYRELATRELQLGRYRRAAYIFGELLRDLHSAANALKQGGFFREAAVIYRDEFKDKLAAAKCLEEGGLLVEAIELYELAGHWEKAGDLYGQLAQHDRAAIAYRHALEQLQKRGELLAAAKLLEEKLVLPDEALDLLTQAWPHAPAASACLAESFRLLDRLSRHEQSSERVASLRDQPPGDQRLMQPLAEVLASLAISYPVSAVKSLAADATRVIAGLRLPAAPEFEARQLISAVQRTSSGDKLLHRDGERFVADLAKRPKPQAKPRPTAPTTRTSTKPPVMIRAFQLTPSAHWRTAISTGSKFFAQGVRQDAIVISQGDWNGKSEAVTWLAEGSTDEAPYRLNCVTGQKLIALPTNPAKQYRKPRHDSKLWVPPNLPSCQIFDIVVDESDTLWVLHDDEQQSTRSLLVSSFDLSGNIRSTRFITFITARHFKYPPALTVRSGRVAVIVGQQVLFTEQGGAIMQLSHEPVSIITSPPHTRWRAAVCFAEGGTVIWPAEQQLQTFGQDLIDPTVCILREGMLVVAARAAGAIYQIDGFQLHHLAKLTLPDRLPIAVVQTHNAGEFAIFYSDGLVQVMRVG